MLAKAVFIVVVAFSALLISDDGKTVLISPGVLRGLADSVSIPVYPIASQKAKHAGVAVVEIVVTPAGRVKQCKVLEAPDTAIANAVETAAKRWTFRSFGVNGTPMTMRSRLIFYFRMSHGKAAVIDALAEGHFSQKPKPE